MDGRVGVDEAENVSGRRTCAAVAGRSDAALHNVYDAGAVRGGDFCRCIRRTVIGDYYFNLFRAA